MAGDVQFGRLTAARRIALALDQNTVARRVGVTQQTISRWESGVSLPRRPMIPALATTLELDPDELHRLAGYATQRPSTPADHLTQDLYACADQLSRAQLLALLDILWRTYYQRESPC
jgi:transcriptional regulator with XRE-family HTH domain